MSEFYIYIHCRPDGSPFYVGKGSNGRSNMLSDRNPHHRNVVKKYGRENIQIVVIPCNSENDAFSQERQLITNFRNLGYELSNKTDGGEGISGWTHSESARKRMSASRIGNKINLGRKIHPEHIAKRAEKLKGRAPWNKGKKLGPLSDGHRAKIAASAMGNKYSVGSKRVAWNKGMRFVTGEGTL